jgi:hypothetical protein
MRVLPDFHASNDGAYTYNFLVPEVSRRKALWLEVGTVSGWLFLPYLVPMLSRNPATMPRFLQGAWGSLDQIFVNLGGLCMMGLILWLSGDPLKIFGIRRFRVHPDIIVSVGLIALLVGTQYIPHRIQLGAASEEVRRLMGVKGGGETILWGLDSLLSVTFGVLVRGYLIARLEELTLNVWIGVVAVAVLNSLSYFLVDPASALVRLGAELALGIAFVKWRCLWPLMAGQLTLSYVFDFLP